MRHNRILGSMMESCPFQVHHYSRRRQSLGKIVNDGPIEIKIALNLLYLLEHIASLELSVALQCHPTHRTLREQFKVL